jgi:flagellar biosynthetic protein FliO
MAGSLVLIIGLILVFVYLLKRYHIGPLSSNRSPVFKLLGTLSLAPKRSIALVEINKQWLVLGVGTERVNLLSKMDRPEEEEVPEDRTDLGSKSFKAMLQDFIAGKRNLIHHDDRRPDEKQD